MAVVLGICAAFLYALGANLQQAEARLARSGALFTWLATRPRWFGGIAINGLGLVCQAVALGHGPLMVVQPLLILSVVFCVPLAHAREPVRPREVVGIVGVALGLVLFFPTVRANPAPLSIGAHWLPPVEVILLLTVACFALARGRIAATLMAIASGLLFGLGATTLKATMALSLATVLSTWPLYATLAANATGFWLLQQAFAAGNLVSSFPAVIAVDPITSACLGAVLFHERVHPLPLALAGAASTLLGIALIGTHPVAAPHPDLQNGSQQQSVNHEHV
ncbi:MAG: DMT family transporter [Candidatus Xenobia bacterium]